jgi:SAM-dependent methyltransferase
MDVRDADAGGHYAVKQIFCDDRLVAWSHRRRFETALAFAAEFGGKRILDFGCGDGTFLGLAMRESHAPAEAVGVELVREYVEDCQHRYRTDPRLRFATVDAIRSSEHAGRYDAVFCMEVLEHVVDWNPELDLLARLLAPEGKLVISVPVETGPPLLVKQLARRIAGWRGIGHYPGTSSYSFRELAASMFAGDAQHLPRPIFDHGAGPFHDHKAFNWKVLRARLARQFTIEQCKASPFPWLGPAAATQVWFVARLHTAASSSQS